MRKMKIFSRACLIENEKLKVEKILVINVYMTTGNTNQIIQENKKKYKEIKEIMKQHKDKEILVMGDMNAHIGILGEKIDRNGENLIIFAEENNLEIGNITNTIGKITWRRIGGKERSAIDYILYNEKSSKKIKEIRIDENKEIDINTDHNMIEISYKTTKKLGNKNTKIKMTRKWKRQNANWKQYKVEIDKLGNIKGKDKEEIMEDMYKKMRRAGEKSIGYTRKIRSSNQKT